MSVFRFDIMHIRLSQRVSLALAALIVGVGGAWWIGGQESCRVAPPTRSPLAALDRHVDLSSSSIESEPAIAATQFSFRLIRTADGQIKPVQLCNDCYGCDSGCGNGCQRPIYGVDCANGCACGEQGWNAWGPIPWQAFGQGEYVGPHRPSHVDIYRVRVDDSIEFVYRLTREATDRPYQLQVGDVMRIESIVDPNLTREVTVQPDGTITALHIGRVRAAGRTVDELKADLEDKYLHGGGYKIIDLTISPSKVNTKLEDLRAAVDSRFFTGGQGKLVRVSPEGTIRLPVIEAVHVVGLTLDEVMMEVNARYAAKIDGIEVTPILQNRAPRFIYVLGEVKQSGRFTMEAPTSVMQSLSLAGGWNQGANLREVVVFRRGEDWRLLATRIDIRGAVYGKSPSPADEIWLRDSDIIVVPKTAIQRNDEFIDQVFTKGIYGVIPNGIVSGLLFNQGVTL